jgi:hypothetical protein
MRTLLRRLREHSAWFFTNWQRSDLPVRTKVWLTVRNRTKGIVTGKMCCGNLGQPGC